MIELYHYRQLFTLLEAEMRLYVKQGDAS